MKNNKKDYKLYCLEKIKSNDLFYKSIKNYATKGLDTGIYDNYIERTVSVDYTEDMGAELYFKKFNLEIKINNNQDLPFANYLGIDVIRRINYNNEYMFVGLKDESSTRFRYTEEEVQDLLRADEDVHFSNYVLYGEVYYRLIDFLKLNLNLGSDYIKFLFHDNNKNTKYLNEMSEQINKFVDYVVQKYSV